jgi:hypothetical protein
MTEARNWPAQAGLYLVHCSVASLGVFLASALVTVLLEKSLNPGFADRLFAGPAHITQLVLGLIAGVLMNRRTHSGSALFSWVPAAIIVAIDVQAYMRIGGVSYVHGHLFGTQCGECIEPLLIVSPFYASLAYSFGALLSFKLPKRSPVESKAEG